MGESFREYAKAATAALVFDEVSFGYTSDDLLEHASFKVLRGESVALSGSNGSGKTTTLKLAAGLLTPSHGSIRIDGVDRRSAPNEARRSIGLVADESLLYSRLTCLENLRLFGLLWSVEKSRISPLAEELLEQSGLSTLRDSLVEELSLGQRQRLGICAAVIHDPTVLLLDEPARALEEESLDWFAKLIETRKADGTAILLATNNTAVSDRLADLTLRILAKAVVGE